MSGPSAASQDASFEHVVDAEFSADLFKVDRLALVGEGGVPRDNERAANPGEVGRQAFRHSVDEGFVVRVAAEVREREHNNRQARSLAIRGQPCCKRRGAYWRPLRWRLARRGFPDSADKAKALTGRSPDEALRLATVADGAPRGIDAAGQRRFGNDPATPDSVDEFVLGDDPAAVTDEKKPISKAFGLCSDSFAFARTSRRMTHNDPGERHDPIDLHAKERNWTNPGQTPGSHRRPECQRYCRQRRGCGRQGNRDLRRLSGGAEAARGRGRRRPLRRSGLLGRTQVGSLGRGGCGRRGTVEGSAEVNVRLPTATSAPTTR
jgi:hypothetical protein